MRFLCERPRDGRDLLEPIYTGNAHPPGDCLVCDADRELARKLAESFIPRVADRPFILTPVTL